jgi:hypothetical protein
LITNGALQERWLSVLAKGASTQDPLTPDSRESIFGQNKKKVAKLFWNVENKPADAPNAVPGRV